MSKEKRAADKSLEARKREVAKYERLVETAKAKGCPSQLWQEKLAAAKRALP